MGRVHFLHNNRVEKMVVRMIELHAVRGWGRATRRFLRPLTRVGGMSHDLVGVINHVDEKL